MSPDFSNITGWLFHEQGEMLHNSAKQLADNAQIVEIGSYLGRSSAYLASACIGSNKKLHCIDRWRGYYKDLDTEPGVHELFRNGFFNEWNDNMLAAGLRDYIIPCIGDSKDVAKSWDVSIDMLFVDGSHDYYDAMADFDNFLPHLKPGCILYFHDVGDNQWPGPTKAWREYISPKLSRAEERAGMGYGIL